MTDARIMQPDEPEFDVFADIRARARRERALRARYFGQPRAMRPRDVDAPAATLRDETSLLDGIDFGPLTQRPMETAPPSARDLIDALDRDAC